jgi:hypothetical protein
VRVTVGEAAQQVTRPATHVEHAAGRGDGRHRERGGASGNLMVQPATPAAVIFGRSVVECGQVTVRRHRSSVAPSGVLPPRVGIATQQFFGVVRVIDFRRTVGGGPAKSTALGNDRVQFAPAHRRVVATASEK